MAQRPPFRKGSHVVGGLGNEKKQTARLVDVPHDDGWHGPHAHDIPLKDIVDLLLSVKAQTYLIEAANWSVQEPRASRRSGYSEILDPHMTNACGFASELESHSTSQSPHQPQPSSTVRVARPANSPLLAS